MGSLYCKKKMYRLRKVYMQYKYIPLVTVDLNPTHLFPCPFLIVFLIYSIRLAWLIFMIRVFYLSHILTY